MTYLYGFNVDSLQYQGLHTETVKGKFIELKIMRSVGVLILYMLTTTFPIFYLTQTVTIFLKKQNKAFTSPTQ